MRATRAINVHSVLDYIFQSDHWYRDKQSKSELSWSQTFFLPQSNNYKRFDLSEFML